jgi:hypothetical protein
MTNGNFIQIFYYGALWSGSSPTTLAQRLANAYKKYGQPNIICFQTAWNTTTGITEGIPQALIDYFHAATYQGVPMQTMVWCHSMFATITLANCQAEIDLQMTTGNHIDIILFDEVNNSNPSFYQSLATYLHNTYGASYQFAGNPGTRDIPDLLPSFINPLSLEDQYYFFSQNGGDHTGTNDIYNHAANLIANYPQKFWGIMADWYIWDRCSDSGTGDAGTTWLNSTLIRDIVETLPLPGGRASANASAYSSWSSLTAAQYEAVVLNLIQEAWNVGIFNFCFMWENANSDGSPAASPGGTSGGYNLPSWFEDLMSKLSGNTVTIGQTIQGGSGAWQSAGVMVASRFPVPSNGNAASITAFIYNAGPAAVTAKAAIYNESNQTFVAATSEVSIPVGFSGWQPFTFASPPPLTSGANYSFTVWFSASNCYLYYNSGSANQSWYAIVPYAASFPTGPYSSLPGYGQENNVYSIYCTVTTPITPTQTYIDNWAITPTSGNLPFTITFSGYLSLLNSAPGTNTIVNGETIQIQILAPGSTTWQNTGISEVTGTGPSGPGYFSGTWKLTEPSIYPGAWQFRAYYAGNTTKNLFGCYKNKKTRDLRRVNALIL